ncbi:nucleic acid-binding protein [Halobacteriales archaeon SW_7_68_16]|nr:MAG: nucleic acid-binding protein [Halobacteriales archaeon SW_7_68_16]
MSDAHREFLDAVEFSDPRYLCCPAGHGSLPPRSVCPVCGATDLTERPLSREGEIVTYTRTNVSMPAFAEDTPYVTAIADFGPVQLTGQIGGDDEGVTIGTTVTPDVARTETDGERVLVFRPV